MQGIKLNIQQQRAEINVEIQNAQLHVKMPRREMVINHEPARMEIRRSEGEVDLDLRAFKSNLGLKNYDEITRAAAQKAKVKAQENVKENVSEGIQLQDRSKGQTIGKLAKNKMMAPKNPRPGRNPVPPPVEMDGKPGRMEIEWVKGGITIDWEGDNLVEVYVEPPHSVEIQLSQRPSVQVSIEEESLSDFKGRKVSAEA